MVETREARVGRRVNGSAKKYEKEKSNRKKKGGNQS